MSFENNRLESRDVRLDGRLGGRKRCGRWLLPIFCPGGRKVSESPEKIERWMCSIQQKRFTGYSYTKMATVLRALCKFLLRFTLIMQSHGNRLAGI